MRNYKNFTQICQLWLFIFTILSSGMILSSSAYDGVIIPIKNATHYNFSVIVVYDVNLESIFHSQTGKKIHL